MRLATNAKEEAQKALKEEAKTRTQANERVSEAQAKIREARRSKTNYESLFKGQMILTIALAIFLGLNRLETFKTMLQWLPARWNNIKTIIIWSAETFLAATHMINEKWNLKNWSYVLTIAILVLLGTGLYILLGKVKLEVQLFTKKIRGRYWDRTFKDFVTADIALISFFFALFFGKAIERVTKLNPTSLWLILSLVGITIWHLPEIRDKVPTRYY